MTQETPNLPEITTKVAAVIIERLELEGYTPDNFPKDAILFADPAGGGLGFDSIASLEIVSGLADAFDLPFDDIGRDDFMSVDSLAAYVARHLGGAA
ncbi:MAG: acyl carrier protein [Nannocystis sp.]|jgi:acyl carrier protein|nr:acyl carrier protein [Nannocystis sp.]